MLLRLACAVVLLFFVAGGLAYRLDHWGEPDPPSDPEDKAW